MGTIKGIWDLVECEGILKFICEKKERASINL